MKSVSIESKLPSVGTTIFTVMTALANAHGALNLAQGFPDFSCEPALIDLVSRHMREGRNQYAPMAGVMELREQIARLSQERYGSNYDPETEITVTPGATEALYSAIAAVVNDGDEVILLEPAYDSYAPAITLNGGIPVHLPLEFPDYSINWEHLKKRINSKTRLIIINSPHNPTGSILSKSDIQKLEKLVSGNDIFIISDEVYEHIIFDGEDHQSLARFPGLRDRTFITGSFGKSLHTTGWRVGFCMAPAYLMQEFRKVHQFNVFSVSTPFQYGIKDFMIERQGYFQDLAGFYQEKRDLFRELVQGSKFKLLNCKGTYFQSVSFEGISDLSDQEFAREMTISQKLASIPVSVFYQNEEDNKVLRFCFAKSPDTLKKAAEILHSF